VNFISITIIAIGLAMDSFAVCVGKSWLPFSLLSGNVYRSTVWPEITLQYRNAGRHHPDCDRGENFVATPA